MKFRIHILRFYLGFFFLIFSVLPGLSQTNCYIYGMHDYNSTVDDLLHHHGEARGWVMILQSLDGYWGGYNQEVVTASNNGLGVLVRLHWGYGRTGTLPPRAQYDLFAARASEFIQTHIDYCIYYSLGNEPNFCSEWPGDGEANGCCDCTGDLCHDVREVITVERYAEAFQMTYHALPEDVQSRVKLVTAPTGVWAGTFACPGNTFDTFDFQCYAQEMYELIPHEMIGGLAFHPKTRNHDPGELTRTDRVGNGAFVCSPDGSVYWYFKVFEDQLADVPQNLRDLPVFFKELNPHDYGWLNINNGYVKEAYEVVHDWNQTPGNQKVTAMMLYRWDDGDDRWDIFDRPLVHQDLREAVALGYQWCSTGPTATPTITPTPTMTVPPTATPTSLPAGSVFNDYMNGIYIDGVAPGWTAWELNNGDALTVFEAGGGADADQDTDTTPANFQIIRTVFNTTGNGQGGVWRKFTNLQSGQTYRITVHLNTLDRDGVWWLEAHRAHHGVSGEDLSLEQLDGRAPLPEGQGRIRPFVKLEADGADTGGQWMAFSTGGENPGQMEGDLELPPGVDSLTVWIKQGGLSDGAVGVDWVTLENLTGLSGSWGVY